MTCTIGLISDTHGLVRPEAFEALRGSDLIVHAGDVGKPGVLEELGEIAPVFAVRGNVDAGEWAESLPRTEVVEAGGRLLYVIHNIAELDLDPVAARFDAVIYGHSHQPKIEERDGVLYMNPGSAGPRRFTLPVAVGRLRVGEGPLDAELIQLRV